MKTERNDQIKITNKCNQARKWMIELVNNMKSQQLREPSINLFISRFWRGEANFEKCEETSNYN